MAELFHEVERLARLPLPPPEALTQLLQFRGDLDTPEGARLLALPLSEAISDAQHWLNAVLIAEPPPQLEALWFDLFNTDEGDGTESLDLLRKS